MVVRRSAKGSAIPRSVGERAAETAWFGEREDDVPMKPKPDTPTADRQRGRREETLSGWSLLASCFGPCSRTAAMAAHPEPPDQARPAPAPSQQE